MFYSGDSHNISKGKEPNLRIKMNKKHTQSAGNSNDIIAKAFWFTPKVEKLIIKNHPLVIKAEEVIFHVPIEFDKNSKGIEISGIDSTSYPIKVTFREGEKVKINDNSDIILGKGQYLSINSGFIELNSNNNNIINIIGTDIDIMFGN